MDTVQLPDSRGFYTQMEMETSTQDSDVSLAQGFQRQFSDESRKRGILDYGKDQKRSGKEKWTNREYCVQKSEDVEHQDVKMYCNINKFPLLNVFDPHNKPHDTRRLSNNYYMYFDPKQGHVTCAICCIPCACPPCTTTLYKLWATGVPPHQQPCY